MIEALPHLDGKLQITLAIFVPLVLVLTALAMRVKEQENDVQINLALLIMGGSVGWLIGIFLSPYGECEKAAFGEYAAAFATFVSGYLLGKIDPFVSRLFSVEFLLQRIVAFRVVMVFSILLLSMLMTFAVREYLPNEQRENCRLTTTLTSQASRNALPGAPA